VNVDVLPSAAVSVTGPNVMTGTDAVPEPR
jgi:hypothetical protein